MADYFTLLGAEDVKHAASQMQQAANSIAQSASAFSFAGEQHQRFMDDWLQRLEVVINAARQERP